MEKIVSVDPLTWNEEDWELKGNIAVNDCFEEEEMMTGVRMRSLPHDTDVDELVNVA